MKTDRKIAEQHIKDAQEALDKAKKDLAKLDKPKLRHGDYGFWSPGPLNKRIPFLFIKNVTGSNALTADPLSDWVMIDADKKTILGNIFDDLAAISEPLEEFKMKSIEFNSRFHAYSGHIHERSDVSCRCESYPDDMAFIDLSGCGWLSKKDLHDFITNLQRMKQTLKGKEK